MITPTAALSFLGDAARRPGLAAVDGRVEREHKAPTPHQEAMMPAVTTTGLIVAPVSLHHFLFRRLLTSELVHEAHLMARSGRLALALVLAGSAQLLLDVVVGRPAGLVAGATARASLVPVWLLAPLRLARRASARCAAAPLPPER